MKFKAQFDGQQHDVAVNAVEGGYEVILDGARRLIDTVRLEASFYSLLIDGRSFELSVREGRSGEFSVRHGSYVRNVKVIDPAAAAAGATLSQSGRAEVTATMPGRVLKLLAAVGDEIAEGQGLIVLEAMKMENEVAAPRSGKLLELLVKEGETLESGARIAVVG